MRSGLRSWAKTAGGDECVDRAMAHHPSSWRAFATTLGIGLPDPKPGLLSAHLKLNLPPAVGVDVLHPEFERAKLGNDGLDPYRHDLTGRHIG